MNSKIFLKVFSSYLQVGLDYFEMISNSRCFNSYLISIVGSFLLCVGSLIFPNNNLLAVSPKLLAKLKNAATTPPFVSDIFVASSTARFKSIMSSYYIPGGPFTSQTLSIYPSVVNGRSWEEAYGLASSVADNIAGRENFFIRFGLGYRLISQDLSVNYISARNHLKRIMALEALGTSTQKATEREVREAIALSRSEMNKHLRQILEHPKLKKNSFGPLDMNEAIGTLYRSLDDQGVVIGLHDIILTSSHKIEPVIPGYEYLIKLKGTRRGISTDFIKTITPIGPRSTFEVYKDLGLLRFGNP